MKLLPIVERELRVASRKAGTYWLRSIAALVLLLIFFWAVLAINAPAARIARVIYSVMGTLVLSGCAVAGIFQTADCLSSEKREGTAGLLFLTDLKGYDVVLGKLAANSLHSYYGLLSILPVLALPMLMGGVTGGEFGRLILVLLATLFFSLSIGMLVSAVSREARQAMIITGAVIIFFNAILPGVYAALSRMHFAYKPLLWPSAGNAFIVSSDVYYKYGTGAREFLDSLAAILGIGFGCLLLATLILPRAWQEKAHAAGGRQAGLWQRLRFGSASRRNVKRITLLDVNPFYWLTARDRLASVASLGLIGVAAPFFLLFFLNLLGSSIMAKGMAVSCMIYTTAGLGLALKCLMATEASRRLNDDRQSGALELLLVTPLSVKEIIQGQRRALHRQFALPMFFLGSMILGLMVCIYGIMNEQDNFAWVIFTGNIAVLMTDFYALGWLGMWAGLRAKNHHRAALSALARVLGLPWLGFLLLILGGALEGTEEKVLFMFSLWFVGGMVNDLFWARWARTKLLKQFRPCAASVLPKRSPAGPMTELKPAIA